MSNKLEEAFLEALERLVKEMGIYGPDPKAKPHNTPTLKALPPKQLLNINTMMDEPEPTKPKKRPSPSPKKN